MSKASYEFFPVDGEKCQRLHETIITRQGEDEQGTYVKPFTGGWRTNTTLKRINVIADLYGWRVYQERGTWKVARVSDPDKYALFVEGMKLYASGAFSI